MRNLSTLLCLLSLIAFSCGKEESNCSGEATPISSEPLTAEGSGTACRLQNIRSANDAGSQVNLVIRSQADYKKYGLCEGALPDIDFSRKTLLAGSFVAPYMDWVEQQRVYRDCEGDVVFEVRLKRGGYTAVTEVFYFAVIPRISRQTEVAFDVSY